MPATPSLVQVLGSANSSVGANTSITLTTPTTVPGNALVAFIGIASTTITITGVADDAGNSWTVEPVATGTADRVYIATCLNPAQLNIGDSITATASSTVNTVMVVAEFFGLKVGGTPRDGTVKSNSGAGTSGTSQAVNTGNLSTANANDILLGAVVSNQNIGDTLSATSWTTISPIGRTGLKIYPAYRVVTSTGNYDLNGSLSGGGTATRAWVDAEYAFKASDTSAPQATFVGAEVASVQDGGRAASFIGVEVAYSSVHAAVTFLGVEVAYTPIPSRRPSPQIIG